MKILLTLGATAEAIDGVRHITNFSTGKTGCAIADGLARRGHDVLALCGEHAQKPQLAKAKIFTDFDDLNQQVLRQLGTGKFDMVIHLAAVSDFSVAKVIIDGKAHNPKNLKKIPSAAKISIELKNNFKIIDKLKTYAKNKPVIVGFKLTNGAKPAAAKAAALKVNADIVVHNDLKDIKAAKRLFTLYKNGKKAAVVSGAAALTAQILRLNP